MIRLDFEPIRPRAVSVVAVIWLYLSLSWLGIALVMLPTFVVFTGMGPGLAFFWPIGLFWFFIAAVAALALRGSLQLLQLRASGRQQLEWANWAAFALFMAFTLHFCSAFGEVPSPWGYGSTFDATRVVVPFLGGTMMSLPFVFMARALRSEEVRFAVRDAEVRRLD